MIRCDQACDRERFTMRIEKIYDPLFFKFPLILNSIRWIQQILTFYNQFVKSNFLEFVASIGTRFIALKSLFHRYLYQASSSSNILSQIVLGTLPL